MAEGGVAKRVEDLEAAAAAGPILLRVEEDFAWLVVLEPDADEEEEEVEGEGRLGVEDDDLNRRAVAPITEDEAENADGRVINRKFEEERAEREDAGAILPPSWRVEGQAAQAFREITGRSMLVAQIVDHNARGMNFWHLSKKRLLAKEKDKEMKSGRTGNALPPSPLEQMIHTNMTTH